MKFTPKPYNQLMNDLLLEKGKGRFEITGQKEKDSIETKRPMLEIQLKVTDSRNRTAPLKYFIMLDDDKDEVLNKLYKVCVSAGKGFLYDEGNIDDRLIGGCGELIIGVGKDKKGVERNNVIAFIVHAANDSAINAKARTADEPPPFNDDDIPL